MLLAPNILVSYCLTFLCLEDSTQYHQSVLIDVHCKWTLKSQWPIKTKFESHSSYKAIVVG